VWVQGSGFEIKIVMASQTSPKLFTKLGLHSDNSSWLSLQRKPGSNPLGSALVCLPRQAFSITTDVLKQSFPNQQRSINCLAYISSRRKLHCGNKWLILTMLNEVFVE
jgi:hypothetical protein